MPARTATAARGGSGVRPSSQEIDQAILEVAAETFAQHGWLGTSVQQIADATGYSKPGLLRRFPSKQDLYDKTLAATRQHAEQLLEQSPPVGAPHRRESLLRALIAASMTHRGTVELIIAALVDPAALPGAEPIAQLVLTFIDELSAEAHDQVGRVRAVLAVQLVVNAALLSSDPAVPEEDQLSPQQYSDLALQLATGVLGD
jgi:AcrR family transcriptional regulator